MIGFVKEPTGRMGNVLIQYVFLRQLAEKIGVDYFHPRLPYEKYFENFKRRRRGMKELFKKKWFVSNDYICEVGIEKFIEEAKGKEDYTIILKTPVLGHLLEWKDENQMRFIEVKDKFLDKRKISGNDNRKKVGLHFRGTDFKDWDIHAVLDFDYYKKAIDYVRENAQCEDARFYLYTDDNEFETYQAIISYLKECKLDFEPGDATRPMMDDFIGLSECDIIISSPSTFAICAALLGKENKLIIHSKKWVDYCINRGEAFWKIVLENRNIYYNTYVM